MAQIFNRWWDTNVGDDPVDRVTTASAPFSPGGAGGNVIVTHVTESVSVFSPNYNQQASNSPPVGDPSTIGQVQPAKVLSLESGLAPFETLFRDFNFTATPYYNFWQPDEEQNDTVERGNQQLTDIPRYIELTWDRAPALKDPDIFRKNQLQGFTVGARNVFTKLSPFGFGAWSVQGNTVGGINLVPDDLQPSNFPANVAKAANGYIAAGVVESVVSVATGTVTPPPAPTSQLIDEDQFLQNDQYWQGITYPEMVSALWRRRSTVYGIQQTDKLDTNLSPTALADKAQLFDGQFGINPASQNTSAHQLVAQSPSSPPISLFAQSAVSSRAQPISRVEELANGYYSPPDNAIDRNQSVKAKFVYTNFAGLLDPARVNNITQAHQAESVIAVAQNASDLAAYTKAGFQHASRSFAIPYDPAPTSIQALQYIGYVIEKWEMVDGAYQLKQTFYVPGQDYNVYCDTRVKYGATYRYRIKSVLRWSRPHGTGVLGPEPTTTDPPGTHINSLTPNDASYFLGEWNDDWAYAQLIDRIPPEPPTELRVRPVSPDKYIEITFKLPNNPQQDINKMTLYRKLQDADGNDLTGWVQMHEFTADLTDPSRQGTRALFTTTAQHQQDDITGTKFNYKKRVNTQVYVEYGPTNARFEDHDVEYYGEKNSMRYVYAAKSFSRHGEHSVLSDQLGARLNKDWKKTGELSVDFVSCAGVNPDFDTGIFGTWPERRLRAEIITKPDPKNNKPAVVVLKTQERLATYPLANSKYVIRVESLDTGQFLDVPISMSVRNFPTQTQVLPYMPLVSSSR